MLKPFPVRQENRVIFSFPVKKRETWAFLFHFIHGRRNVRKQNSFLVLAWHLNPAIPVCLTTVEPVHSRFLNTFRSIKSNVFRWINHSKVKKCSVLLVSCKDNEEDSLLVIKEGVEQQKLMVNIRKSAALDNQHLRIPKNSWRTVQYIDDNFEQGML